MDDANTPSKEGPTRKDLYIIVRVVKPKREKRGVRKKEDPTFV